MRRIGIRQPMDFDEALIEVERRIIADQPNQEIQKKIDSWWLTEADRRDLYAVLYGEGSRVVT